MEGLLFEDSSCQRKLPFKVQYHMTVYMYLYMLRLLHIVQVPFQVSIVSNIPHIVSTCIYHTFKWIVQRRWLVKYCSPSSSWRQTKWLCWYTVTNKVTLWAIRYSACVVYTKTIIHFSVSESGGYLPPLRWIIVNYTAMQSEQRFHKCFQQEGN